MDDMRRLLTVSTLVVLAMLVGACTENPTRSTPEGNTETNSNGDTGTPPDAGGGADSANEAPDFSFETFEGETFSLEEQRGTPVVLNFWESW